MQFNIVSENFAKWEKFEEYLKAENVSVHMLNSHEQAYKAMKEQAPTINIIDIDTDIDSIRATLISYLMVDACVHLAAVSAMDPDTFHDYTEGLGVLTSLPSEPNADDAKSLLATLKEMKV